jgi:hypothetical protein
VAGAGLAVRSGRRQGLSPRRGDLGEHYDEGRFPGLRRRESDMADDDFALNVVLRQHRADTETVIALLARTLKLFATHVATPKSTSWRSTFPSFSLA